MFFCNSTISLFHQIDVLQNPLPHFYGRDNAFFGPIQQKWQIFSTAKSTQAYYCIGWSNGPCGGGMTEAVLYQRPALYKNVRYLSKNLDTVFNIEVVFYYDFDYVFIFLFLELTLMENIVIIISKVVFF